MYITKVYKALISVVLFGIVIKNNIDNLTIMFCAKCGKENSDNATFCAGCGVTLNAAQVHTSEKYFSYYGKDWQRKGVMGFSAMPYHDVAVDDMYIYVIELPKYSWATWGTVIGLVLLNLIGALIGYAIGSSRDSGKRQGCRSSWVGANGQIISRKFEVLTFQKIPLSDAHKILSLDSKSFCYVENDKKFKFKTTKKGMERFKSVLINQ